MKTFTNIDYLTHLRWPPYHQHAGLSPKHAGRSPNLGWRRKCQRGFITIDIALAMTLSTISMVAAVYKVHTEIAQILQNRPGSISTPYKLASITMCKLTMTRSPMAKRLRV